MTEQEIKAQVIGRLRAIEHFMEYETLEMMAQRLEDARKIILDNIEQLNKK